MTGWPETEVGFAGHKRVFVKGTIAGIEGLLETNARVLWHLKDVAAALLRVVVVGPELGVTRVTLVMF